MEKVKTEYDWVRIIFFVVIVVESVVLAGIFLYLVNNDSFKDSVNCGNTSLVCESIEIPECPKCPGQGPCVCECGDCPDIDFPSKLEVTLKNGT